MRSNAWLLLLLLSPLCGCCSSGSCNCWSSPCWPNCYVPCTDDCKVKIRAEVLAQDAIKRCGGQNASCHYREGFCDAYVDIAQGSDGLIPAAPPQRYWGMMFRTPGGHARAEEWFIGYRAGVDSALAEGLADNNWVPMSYTSSGGADVMDPGMMHDD